MKTAAQARTARIGLFSVATATALGFAAYNGLGFASPPQVSAEPQALSDPAAANRRAGWNWAAEHKVSSPARCAGATAGLREGCLAYANGADATAAGTDARGPALAM